MVWGLMGWIVLWITAWFARRLRHTPEGRGRRTVVPVSCRAHPKPAWVRREVIRLKALMPDARCRLIADTFNRRFAVDKRMTVGKSFVAETVRKHCYEIQVLRRKIKHARPKPIPRNLVWGLDLTGKVDITGNLHMVFGLIDHGSRALLSLAALPNKCSWTVLGHLFLAVGRYGKPKFLRTDNEACFTSRLFTTVLELTGIRQQRSELHCPWQNGRIERLFGTLKQKLDQWEVANFKALNGALAEFRFFYNIVRPHQNLEGRTPAEAGAGINPFAAKVKGEYWFEAWGGLLQGYYLRR